MRNKKFTSVVAVILAVILLASLLFSVIGSVSASAVSQSEIDALQSQRDEIKSKMSDISEQISAIQDEMATVTEKKEALDEQNTLLQEDIALIDEQIAAYDELIAEKAQEVEEAQAQEEEQLEKYSKRVRAMEENSTWSYFDVLFQATSFSEFLSTLYDIFNITERDQSIEDAYVASRENLQQVKAEYEATQEEQESKKADLETEKEALQTQIDDATAIITELEANITEYEAAYDEAESQADSIQSSIDSKIAQLEAERKAAEAAAAAKAAAEAAAKKQSSSTTTTTTTTTSTTTYAGYTGAFIWPSSCTYITSLQGYRVHPIFGTTKYHSGVDIGASAGSPIYAAAAGTVLTAEYSSSYGNYVVIYHNDGLSTLYGHMSSIAVTAGSTVTQGQVIGYVGSTGWSTGPHLHFEVRVNGSVVDPMSYFSGINFTYASDVY